MTLKQPRPALMTTTLWEFPSQHYGNASQGDNDYIGVTPSYVIWNLLQRYTKPGDVVLDPMCGSGTTLDVAKDLRRQGVGFDIAPSRPDIKQADARTLPLTADSVDFAFIDPPYSNHIRYSGQPECIGELDARGGGYYEAMEKVIGELARVLKDGSYLALYVSDSFAKGKAFCPLGFELFLRMTRTFDPVDIVCVTRHNKTLKRNHFHTAAIEGNYFLRGFNYLFIMRKAATLAATERFRHEDAGWLSPLWQSAVKMNEQGVMTPEKFSQQLADEPDKLVDNLSRKKQKKLMRQDPVADSNKARERGPAAPAHKGRHRKKPNNNKGKSHGFTRTPKPDR